MTELRIPLFPVDSTAVTVTMTVWLGVCVVVFFNLRFGWTLSGLVVPGYLVPLLFVKPIAVLIIFAQAILTYLIVRILSDGWGRLPWWSSFFGRDRFFVLVLVSILVRAATDGWLLPLVGKWCNSAYGLQIDYRNDLHSYGLIIVSLLANYFWKPRLLRGVLTSATTVGLTYLLVKYVLLSFTNFSLGSLHYLYDDVSTSLLASPKAYVVVITTAFVASWLNLRYSWDFNGILIPALLALLWHEPSKVAVSVAESMWILCLGSTVLKLPLWRGVTMEGGRKLLLFFTLAAAHRLLLAHLLPLCGDVHVTDAFGFGYLLTTLVAVKSHDKNIALRICRATVQASMMGAVLASLLGFALSTMPLNLFFGRPEIVASEEDHGVRAEHGSLGQMINRQRVNLYRMKIPGSYQTVLPSEMDDFSRGVLAALRFCADSHDSDLQQSAEHLTRAHYHLSLLEDRYLVLTELEPVRGWGTYVLDRQAGNELLVEVPAPLEEWATLESGLAVFQQLEGRALAVAGAARRCNDDRSSDVLVKRHTMMTAFHRLLDQHDTLQIRGYTEESVAAIEGYGSVRARQAVDSMQSTLWVKRSLPKSLNLSALNRLVQPIETRWRDMPEQNVLRAATPRGYAELVLNRHDRRRLRNRVAQAFSGVEQSLERVDGYLNSWLRDDRLTIARQGSNAYRPAIVEEMLFMDEEVLRPLIMLARRIMTFQNIDEADWDQLRSTAAAAAVLDYQLLLFHDLASGRDSFVLHEPVPRQRHWGTFVFRAGLNSPYLIEVPRPLYERQTHQFGAACFDRFDAAALLIAGAHPFANGDGTSDLVRLVNKVNAYQLVRQVLLRELAYDPLLVVQTRAIQAPIDADLVVATDDGASSRDELSTQVRELVERMEADGLRTRLVNGDEQTAGYELGLLFQASSLNHAVDKELIAIWLSPSLRQDYRDSTLLTLMESQFRAVGIQTVRSELCRYVSTLRVRRPATNLDPDVISTVRHYCDSQDVMHLYRLVCDWPTYHFTRLIDLATDQSFLLVQATPHSLPSIFNLDGAPSDRSTLSNEYDCEVLRQFARSRQFLLQPRSTP